MATLNKTKRETQLILKWGGISLLIISLFLVGIRLTAFVKKSFAPTPPPQASFGKLPSITFPNQQKENITYTLDTLTGFLPNFGDRAKVYKTNMNQPTLLALENMQKKVSRVGFSSAGVQISQDVYQWLNSTSSLQKRLTMNIFSQDFTLSSLYLAAASLQTFNNSDEQNNAIDAATSFLSNMSLTPDDLDKKKTKTTLYSIEKGALIPTSKLANAKIIRVGFFQKDIQEFPIYYENGAISTIDFLIGKENEKLEIVEAHYSYKNISEVSSTYAIKTASQAFSELKQGKVYVASNPQGLVEISIKKVFLGYYIGENQQDFLMPIIIFEGNNDFLAYVSAVKDEWINN